VPERIVNLVILAEDLRSARFLRQYAARRIVHPRAIETRICHSGSADQFVRNSFPDEVKKQRWCVRGQIKKAALLVHVDADTGTVAAEHQLLAKALNDAGELGRTASERIAVVVPKYSIETWIHGLSEVSVDEDYDYKRDRQGRIGSRRDELCDKRIPHAAKALLDLTRPHAAAPPASMPALVPAVGELRRLEQ
jgi:hypothetical protein